MLLLTDFGSRLVRLLPLQSLLVVLLLHFSIWPSWHGTKILSSDQCITLLELSPPLVLFGAVPGKTLSLKQEQKLSSHPLWDLTLQENAPGNSLLMIRVMVPDSLPQQ